MKQRTKRKLIKHPPTAAGGGAYYFAKRSINADRAARHEADMNRKRLLKEMEQASVSSKVPDSEKIARPNPPSANASSQQRIGVDGKPDLASTDDVGSPSSEASHDPAPTRHEPVTDEQRLAEKSKYEASEKFKPIKGNRLSN